MLVEMKEMGPSGVGEKNDSGSLSETQVLTRSNEYALVMTLRDYENTFLIREEMIT